MSKNWSGMLIQNFISGKVSYEIVGKWYVGQSSVAQCENRERYFDNRATVASQD
ncbi:hypothetical protein IMG5_045960 [Ichthyophthirius multifiliis]|uniref:Uncharacterized protein n=1 Tax=Ichthyophthirius multifiliis TaxID=5932 RepID=G0QM78_ICHMU|nr:hypothetical protein IMG5_045960 [Ichthyophthirius multifiliis]EGR33681.1 hypothetical protein IMG5_045960 [Ichthyophthirius multifiliis]|eukprot:XP_004037667.1 hypothetical protein IMG5_045960 [Ichthyophthirius multifiliis]